MLTKTDLEKITLVVKGEVNPLKKAVEAGDKELSTKIEAIDKKLSTKIDILDKKLDRVQKDVGEYLNHLEPRVTIVEKRVDDIEESLNIPKSQ